MGVQKSKVSFSRSSKKFYTNYNFLNYSFFNTNFVYSKIRPKKKIFKFPPISYLEDSSDFETKRLEHYRSLRIRIPYKSFNTSYLSFKKLKLFSIFNKILLKIGGTKK